MLKRLDTQAYVGRFECQRGVVLYIAMIMLFIMALIGVAGLTISTKEERLSANFMDNNVAFQAAEAALLEGEATATELAETGQLLTDYFNDTQGRFNTNAFVGGRKPWLDNTTWTGANSFQINYGTNPPVAEQPRFILEYISEVEGSGSENVMKCSYGNYACVGNPPMMLIRVTARGVGTNPDTSEMLQSLVRVRMMPN